MLLKCWYTPIYFQEYKSYKWIGYGWPKWPSRSVWLVPGTYND